MEAERILLIRTDRIGDVVLTLPAVSAIHHRFPRTFIAFLAGSDTVPLVENHAHIDQILTYDPKGPHRGLSGHLQLARELKSLHFDTAILFHPRLELSTALAWAGIPKRIGTGYRWYSFLFTHRIREHRRQCRRHEADYNMGLLAPLIPSPPTPRFHFRLRPNLLQWREATLRNLRTGPDYSILHPGSGGSAANLTVDQYRAILRFLLRETVWPVFLTGTSSERRLAERVAEGTPEGRVLNMAGRFSLDELMVLLRGARLLVTTSTGPLHIANALNTPVLAFFCPALPQTPRRWGPYNQQEWVVVPESETPPRCRISRCPLGGCLQSVSERQIVQRLAERLETLRNPEDRGKDTKGLSFPLPDTP